ncbi:MAG: FAH family protein [Verrucomicrobia bacterium]|nr:FAH family protein [Verrucomicrobiota bacterium]
MNLVQFKNTHGDRCVGVPDKDGSELRILNGFSSVYDLVFAALEAGRALTEFAEAQLSERAESYDTVINERRLLVPLDHPDPSRCWVSLTGLTHLGSAKSRDSMHAKLVSDPDQLTDSMKMFRLGYEGGKPATGKVGVAPEWAFKGDGQCLIAPEQPISSPAFAADGGEEAEIAGVYVIDPQGVPVRVGFALGNEFSDHVTERQNYLYLAHSKLRECSVGPELYLAELPAELAGTVRILRNGQQVWSGNILSGEANMCHSIANLEHHHFKYRMFRRPGDVHIHFFGASLLSCQDGFRTEPDDIVEIESKPFGRPLRNQLVWAKDEGLVTVRRI